MIQGLPQLVLLICPILVAILGLLSAAAVRMSIGSRHQTAWQAMYLVCLLMVGASVVNSLGTAPGCWIALAGTLSLMVVLGTCDFRRSREAVAW